jgi:hypothetical protein
LEVDAEVATQGLRKRAQLAAAAAVLDTAVAEALEQRGKVMLELVFLIDQTTVQVVVLEDLLLQALAQRVIFLGKLITVALEFIQQFYHLDIILQVVAAVRVVHLTVMETYG